MVVSNYKPGILESLGLNHEMLCQVNLDIIMMANSTLNNIGHQRLRLGYGSLTRAAMGLSRLRRHPDVPNSFCDSVTIYRIHLASRGFMQTPKHPSLPAPLPSESSPGTQSHMPAPELHPAPHQAEYTREIAAAILGLSDAGIEKLIAWGEGKTMAAPKTT